MAGKRNIRILRWLIVLLAIEAVGATFALCWYIAAQRDVNEAAFQTVAKDRPTLDSVSCLDDPEHCRPERVIFFGVDGCTWRFLAEGIKTRGLHNFKRVISEGSIGLLHSFSDFYDLKSPVIWATIATGVTPERHGISNFFTEKRMFHTTAERKSKAFWNILSEAGKKVGVVGWINSYPAETVNGVYVSDRGFGLPLAYATEGRLRDTETYPPEALDRFKDLIASNYLGGLMKDPTWKEGGNAPDQIMKFYLKSSRKTLLEIFRRRDALYASIAERVLDEDRPDLTALYLMHTDYASHRYYLMPSRVFETYRAVDEVLGKLLARMDDKTLLIICSDHGFSLGPLPILLTTRLEMVGNHNTDGVLILYGKGVPKGTRIVDPGVYDMAPTVLRAFGFKGFAGMPGRSLLDYPEDADFKLPADFTLERDLPLQRIGLEDWENRELFERLKTIGYLQ